MSTDEFGERTQLPTERRRREARSRGEVARSADLVAALVLLASMASLWRLGSATVETLTGLLRESLSPPAGSSMTVEGVTKLLTMLAARLSLTALPIVLIAVSIAALSNLVQTGFLWVPQALVPRFERLHPSRGLSRWFSLNTWFGIGSDIVKLTVLAAVLVAFVRMRLPSSEPLAQGEPSELLSLSARLMCELGLLLSLSLVVLALLDYGYRFWWHERSLRMTVEELRREQREEEGDPRLKRTRRDIATARTVVPEAYGMDGVRSV